MRCFFGFHKWRKYEGLLLGTARGAMGRGDCRICDRCNKQQRRLPKGMWINVTET